MLILRPPYPKLALKMSMAKKMLANNEPTERITEYTGLTSEEIEKLK